MELKPIVRKAKICNLGQRSRPLPLFPLPNDPINSVHFRAAGYHGIGKDRVRCTVSEPLRYWLGNHFDGTAYDPCKDLDLVLSSALNTTSVFINHFIIRVVLLHVGENGDHTYLAAARHQEHGCCSCCSCRSCCSCCTCSSCCTCYSFPLPPQKKRLGGERGF